MTKFVRTERYNSREKGDAMYIEIYMDSLFLVNFVMNLYLLLLVNRSVFCTATRMRLFLGAAAGALVYLLPFLWEGAAWLKMMTGMLLGSCLMIFLAFPIHSFKMFWRIAERLFVSSFLMGGGVIFLLQHVSFLRKHTVGIFAVMGAGAVIYLVVTHLREHRKRKNDICSVTLSGRDGTMKIAALLDSGNSLVEPISGKPVSVIDQNVFRGLWREAPELYRVIPYHSIGKERGLLKGYLLPEILIEMDGVTRKCKDVYVAVSEENISGDKSQVKMIVNPVLLKG